MRTLTIDQFKNRQLRNGEQFILIFDVGHPITLEERQQVVSQIENETNRFKIRDEWTDPQGKYYIKIEVTKNVLAGLAVILVLSTIVIISAGYALSEILSGVVEVTEKSVPLAMIGLVGVIVILGYRWIMRKNRVK